MTTSIVTTLLVNTIIFSLLFGFIVLLRKLLSGKISAVLQYALLAIVVLKLVIPFGFDSSISPLGWTEHHSDSTKTVQSEARQPELYAYSSTQQMPVEGDTQAAIEASEDTTVQSLQKETTQIPQTAIKTASLDWSVWICIAWLVGVIAMVLRLILGLRIIKRRTRHTKTQVPKHIVAVFDACKKELGIKRSIKLVMQRAMPVPAVAGIIKPMLIVPDSLANMEAAALRNIFLHELTHFKYGDVIAIWMMSCLNCLYWFNPLVWVCFKLMRNDLETICDQRCLRLMDRETQKGYVNTVLHFAALPSSKRLQAAIAMTSELTAMENRIRNMFKTRRTKGAVRILVMLVAIMMLVTCVLTACQPTPEKEVVVGKGDGLPSQALNKEIDENSIPDVPEKWSYTVELNDDCKITIDAEIELPDTHVFPVYRLERNELTQERLNELINYFAPNAKFYEHGVFTKEYYEQRLIEAKRGQFVDGKYVPPPADDPWVKSIEQKLVNAPLANEMTPVSTDFDYYSDYDGNVDESRGKNFLDVNFTTEDGKSGSIFAMKYDMGNAVDNRFGINSGINWITQSEMQSQGVIPEEERQYYTSEDLAANDRINQILADGFFDHFTLTQDQAIGQANQVIADLGIDSMGIVHVEKVMVKRYSGMAGFSDVDARDQGYVIKYARMLDELDGFINNSMTNPEGDDNQDAYAPPFAMETITMAITDSGIEYFGWGEMAQKAETVSENSELLPFEEIQERIINQLKFENIPDTGSGVSIEIKIDKIRLLSGYINVKNDLNSVWHIPVWVVQGSIVYTRENGEADEYRLGNIVINSLDGGRVLGEDGSRYTS